MKKNNVLIVGICLVIVILISLQCSAYIKSSVQGLASGSFPRGFSSSGGQWIPDRTMCEAGQDFAVQIEPFGCEPVLVTSDLLEEQNVPVLCQLSATKINPLIGVEAIDSISFSGAKLPESISGVGFYPAQAALGTTSKLNSPLLNNIGYAVIVLKKQPNASAVPKSVSGNLTAILKYNIKEAYGIGETKFYLSEISDDAVWEDSKEKYGFWNSRGYLRAESVDDGGARISVYDDKGKLKTVSLEKGEESSDIYLPGFDCLVATKLKLEELSSPDTTAILKVNGDTLYLRKGEKFLENKCTLLKTEKRGLTQKVQMSCTDDEGRSTFELVMTPKVSLNIDGVLGEYSVGDRLYSGTENGKQKYVYLSYIGTKFDSGKLDDLYVVLIAQPFDSGSRLSDSDIATYASRAESLYSNVYKDKSLFLKTFADIGSAIKKVFYTKLVELIAKSTDVKFIPYKTSSNDNFFTSSLLGEDTVSHVFFGKNILVIDFASPVNKDISSGSGSSSIITSTIGSLETTTNSGDTISTPDQMYDLLTITDELGNKITTDYSKEIKEALTFLMEQFGAPFVTSKIPLKIYSSYNEGHVFWSTKSGRTIQISEIMISGKSERGVLVHELFHAFYETDSFLKANKDLDSEGLAIYAEYKYKYGSVFSEKLSNDLYYKKQYEPSDLSKSFKDYEGGERDYMYIYAGNKYKDKSSNDIRNLLLTYASITSSSSTSSSTSSTGNTYNYYTSASQDYSKVTTSYAAEKNPLNLKESDTLGEKAFINSIELANHLNQKADVKSLCEKFKEKYDSSDSYKSKKEFCENAAKISNGGSSIKELTINSAQKIIYFEGIKEPNFEEFGVNLKVKGSNMEYYLQLEKDKMNYFGEDNNHFVQLRSINGDTISIYINTTHGTVTKSTADNIASLFRSQTVSLTKGTPSSFGTDYTFEIIQINNKKSAKVSVNPTINKAQTEANFTFNIGIETRAIELSPEKTRERIEELNKTIEKWEKISENLNKTVKVMKGACLATGLALTMKNFVNNLNGESIARTKVMSGEDGNGGWNKKCADMVNGKKPDTFNKDKIYLSVESCIMANSDNIDKEVDISKNIIQKQDEIIKPLQEGCKSEQKGFLFETIIKTDCLQRDYSEVVSKELSEMNSLEGKEFSIGGKKVEYKEAIALIKDGKVSIEEMRTIQYYARASSFSEFSESSTKELDSLFSNIYASNQREIELKNMLEGKKLSSGDFQYLGVNEKAVTGAWRGKTYEEVKEKTSVCSMRTPDADSYTGLSGCASYRIDDKTPVEYFATGTGAYLAFLKKVGEKYTIDKLYDIKNGDMVNDEKTLSTLQNQITFELRDAKSYENKYTSSSGSSSSSSGPTLRCYDDEQKTPGIVPVDTTNGWYVSIEQGIATATGKSSIDNSGRVMSYYICNVMANGKEENRGGDDDCTGINLGTGQTRSIAHLTPTQSTTLINDAAKSIELAQKICQKGKAGVFNLGKAKNVKMGTPATKTQSLECTNFMSPNDCKILFNVCDPVICPTSRCDYGGKFPVKDVIGSGIIGSLVLCLPNFVKWQGEVYIPICLSGILAGMDSLISVFKGYRDCLQNSLDTGELTGSCDQINSFYICKMVWDQALPFAKMIIPKTIELVMGKATRGGGEYLSVQDAWSTAAKSVDSFAQYYAADSYAAFKSKIVQSMSEEVCGLYISGAYPDGENILDTLTNPKSPPQYYGQFEETTYTTATNPSISHYKVFYHIYAGKDSRAYYQIYLTEGPTSSYYQDTSSNYVVATGYIEKGGYESQTPDFTAVSGYKKLCITVNGKTDCGFGKSSSSFAVDYVSDQYVKDQANRTDITSESECVSGSSSAWSLATTSLQGAVSEVANPELYNRGIIRVCANQNPGSGTDTSVENSRWVSVGYCGKKELKCWLDTQSVKEAVNFQSTATETITSLTDSFLKQMIDEGKYLSEDKFKEKINEIESKDDSAQKIALINSVLKTVAMNAQKGLLYLLRGNAYGELARERYKAEPNNELTIIIHSEECSAYLKAINSFSASVNVESPTLDEINKKFSDGLLELHDNQYLNKEEYDSLNVFSSTSKLDEFKSVLLNLQKVYNSKCLVTGEKTPDTTLKPENTYEYYSIIEEASSTFGINRDLIKKIIGYVSEGNLNFESDGKYGLMGLSEGAINKDIVNSDGGCHNSCFANYNSDNWKTDAKKNIFLGTCYLSCLSFEKNCNDEKKLLSIYFGGIEILKEQTSCESIAVEELSLSLSEENKELVNKLNTAVTSTYPDGSSKKLYSSSNGKTSVLLTSDERFLKLVFEPSETKDVCKYATYSIFNSINFAGVNIMFGKFFDGEMEFNKENSVFLKNILSLNFKPLEKYYVKFECMNGPVLEDSSEYIKEASLKTDSFVVFNSNPNFNSEVCAEEIIIKYNQFISLVKKEKTDSKYSDAKSLVDSIYANNLVTYSQYKEIKGGSLFDWEGDMKELLEMLITNYQTLCPKDTSSETIEIPTVEEDCTDNQFNEMMKGFAESGQPSCNCGTNCENYASEIIKASNSSGIDSLLLLSLMIKESNCNNNKVGGSGEIGLMQITPNYFCRGDGTFGLNRNVETCTNQLANYKTNIDVGAQILSKYYKESSKGINDCETTYTGWNAAVRKYNGLKKCNSYVDDVTKIHSALVYNCKNQITSDTFYEPPSVGTPELSELRQELLASVDKFDGVLVQNKYSANCFTAIQAVYSDASMGLSKCVYSPIYGTKYSIIDTSGNSQEVTLGESTFATAVNCDYSSSSTSYDEAVKKIIPGDIINFVFNRQLGHSVIFINWVEGKEYQIARVFDWRGEIKKGEKDSNGNICESSICKTYSYNNYDLSIDKHPVYRIWNPVKI